MRNRDSLWRFGKGDIPSVVFIVLATLVVAAPQLLDWVKADPMLYVGMMATGVTDGWFPGRPSIDPNNGFGTQALGYRAALDWLGGQVPWWNPYSGVGLPLAAEYQPGAFFPLTFLLLLPRGMVALQLALQILSGLGTYALLRQLGAGRLAATLGGVVYAFNGTLAWFAHAPAQPVPFLPWMLVGIERAWAATQLGLPRGWRLFAVAMAMSLLCAFPETAYISGLLALAWAVVRGVQTPAALRGRYASRIALGGVTGILLAAPQVMAFFQYLPHAFIGGHDDFAHAALNPEAIIPSLLAPYVYGPIFAYADRWALLGNIWGSIGGYVSAVLLVLAAYGFLARRSALAWLLAVWCVLALAKTFHIEPAVMLWNLVPGIPITAFARYAQPSWELALVLLAAWGLDDLVRSRGARRGPFLGALLVFVVAIGGGLLYGAGLWHEFSGLVRSRNWALGSAVWAAATALGCVVLIRLSSAAWAPRAIAALLMVDAALLFGIATLSNPRTGVVDMPAIDFLKSHLGLQRFYTLGPIQPNYGAYFGIASINHNYLPVSKRWVEWIGKHLDSAADAVVFNGEYPRAKGRPSQLEELRRNRSAYEWAGVKYVVAAADVNPFPDAADVKRVYRDGLMGIFELPGARPYFEVLSGRCAVEVQGRTGAVVDCEGPASLLRRELFFPGWKAQVNASEVEISEHGELFQAIALPAGRSEVRYRYAPPHIAWAWLAALVALGTLAFPVRRR
jgi:hypothetical protein